MMKYLLHIFSLIIVIPCLGQKFDLKIDSIINIEIKKKHDGHVRKIGYTKLVCVNYGIRATAYLFWNEGEKSYIQKFEDSEYDKIDVRKFRPIAFVDSVFFPFFIANGDLLRAEEIKSFENEMNQTIVTSHSCFRHFKLQIGDSVFDRYFDFFDLSEFDMEQIDNSKLSEQRIEELRLMGWEGDTLYKNIPKRNINYQCNTESKIAQWDIVLSKFIEKIESTNEFIEIKS